MTIPGNRMWRSLLLAIALGCGCGGKSTTATVDMQAKLDMMDESWVLTDCTTAEQVCVSPSKLEPWWDVLASPDAGPQTPAHFTPFYVDMRAQIGAADREYFWNVPCTHEVVEVEAMRTLSETIPATCGY